MSQKLVFSLAMLLAQLEAGHGELLLVLGFTQSRFVAAVEEAVLPVLSLQALIGVFPKRSNKEGNGLLISLLEAGRTTGGMMPIEMLETKVLSW